MKMTSIKAAILATVQRVREYYQIFGGSGQKAIAIPPEWANIAPLVLHLQDKSQWSAAEKIENEYELSRFVNAIINHPFAWDGEGEVLWDVLRQVLDANNSEITEDVLDSWADARYLLEEHYVKTQLQDIDYQVTYLDSGPQWNKVEITAGEFAGLHQRAEGDAEFSRIYEIIRGGELDELVDIKKISFEMASISIERPWLKEELLESRQWRLRNNATVNGKPFLSSSDQEQAFMGALPGYLAALILVRNFEVYFEVASTENEEGVEAYLEEGHTLHFGPVLLNNDIKTFRIAGKKQMMMNGLSANLKSVGELKHNLQLNHISGAVGQNSLHQAPGAGNISTVASLSPAAGAVQLQPKINLPGGLKPTAVATHQLTAIPFLAAAEVSVMDNQGKPIDQAEVAFRQVEKDGKLSSHLAQTGPDGKARLKLAANSRYEVLVTRLGYKSQRLDIATKMGEKVVATARLEPKTTVESKESLSDIQLLAVVYRKLGASPNPVKNFVALDE